MKNKILLPALLLTLVFSSCSYRVMDFTIVSSKNIELSKFPTYEKGTTRVDGKDTKPIILFFPTGYPDGKEAIDRAIESVPGAVALLDGVLTYKYFYIPMIYGEYTYVVEGTPLIDPAVAQSDKYNALEDYSICMLDKEGNIVKTIELEEEEYYTMREEIFKAPNRMYNKLKK